MGSPIGVCLEVNIRPNVVLASSLINDVGLELGETMVIQIYDDDNLMRGFSGNNLVFECENVNWRKLDAMGLPRMGKPNGKPWKRTGWGYQIDVEFSAKLKK